MPCAWVQTSKAHEYHQDTWNTQTFWMEDSLIRCVPARTHAAKAMQNSQWMPMPASKLSMMIMRCLIYLNPIPSKVTQSNPNIMEYILTKPNLQRQCPLIMCKEHCVYLCNIRGFEHLWKCAGAGRSERHEHSHYNSLKCAEASDGEVVCQLCFEYEPTKQKIHRMENQRQCSCCLWGWEDTSCADLLSYIFPNFC
jgi:hypothetical protein